MGTHARTALGIDIGGTGIKGALVDVGQGTLLSDRVKLPTPQGGSPDGIAATVAELLTLLPDEGTPVGICFPAVVRAGRTMSAANVSSDWIGLDAQTLFESALNRPIAILNDADAAGVAELRFGAASGAEGVTIVTTLGTGIGSALLINGVLVPNTELGHIEVNGGDAERAAAYSAKEREDLSWTAWAERLQAYYSTLEKLFSPDLFVVGGGVSKHHEKFLPLLELNTPIVPAAFRNNAGILGAAEVGAQISVR
ncbi:MAG: polyphosphate--glucose phosphotransferase [Mycetocola sp.]